MKSINAIIVKPNQNGSLIEVKKVCELAKKNNIKIVFLIEAVRLKKASSQI